MNILEEIIAHKHLEVAERRTQQPFTVLEAAVRDLPPARSLRRSLANSDTGIIAEFKRRSPSKGWIKANAEVEKIIPAYVANGAAGLSILTDTTYFGGRLADVEMARPLTDLPLLRKEFIVDEYQLFEARVAQADAILLIAAALSPTSCHRLAATAHDLGLEVLLEIHEAAELDAYSPAIDLIGVNNRDLRTFRTDPEQSVRLLESLPTEVLPISESGLLDPKTAHRLHACGYRGFLVGEAFMKEEDPGKALAEYIRQMRTTSI